MNRYKKAFKKKVFMPFTVIGDPDIKTSEKIIKEMIDSGATREEVRDYVQPIREEHKAQRDELLEELGIDSEDIPCEGMKGLRMRGSGFRFKNKGWMKPTDE